MTAAPEPTTRIIQQSPVTQTITGRMRDGRIARGWSAAELADRMTAVGTPWRRGTVADLENSYRRDVTADELVALARVFNVSVTALLDHGTGLPALSIEDRLERLEAAVFKGVQG